MCTAHVSPFFARQASRFHFGYPMWSEWRSARIAQWKAGSNKETEIASHGERAHVLSEISRTREIVPKHSTGSRTAALGAR